MLRIPQPRPADILWMILYLLPPVVLVSAIAVYGVGVLFLDEIDFIPSIHDLVVRHHFDFAQFLGQHIEHRPVIPRLIIAAFALITRWNVKAELFVAPVLAGINALLLAILIRRTLPDISRAQRRLLILTMIVFSFSLTQWQNWMQSIELSRYLCLTFFLTAVVLLWRRGNLWRLGLAALACFLSSFCQNNGLASWIACLPLVAVWSIDASDRGRSLLRSALPMAIWLALSIGTWVLYYYNFVTPERNFEVLSPVQYPTEAFQFFYLFLGTVLAPFSQPAAMAAGVLIIALTISSVVSLSAVERERLLRGIPWIAIIIFVAISAAGGSIQRAGISVSHAAIPKYIAIAMLAVVSLLSLLHLLHPTRTTQLRTLCIFLILLDVFWSASSLPFWKRQQNQLVRGRACLETYTLSSSRCLDLLYSGGERLRSSAPRYAEIGGFTPFRLPPTVRWVVSSGDQYGVMDMFAELGPDSIFPDSGFEFGGWAILDDCQPARHILLTRGPQRTLIGHTTAALERTVKDRKLPVCQRYAGWAVAIDRPVAPWGSGVQAWVFDQHKATAYLLPRHDPNRPLEPPVQPVAASAASSALPRGSYVP